MMKTKLIHTTTRRLTFIVLIVGVIFSFYSLLTNPTSRSSSSLKLGPYYEIFRDSSASLTIDDLLTDDYHSSFTASTDNYLNFWHTDDVVWLRLQADELLLEHDKSYWLELIDKLESITMYLVNEDGSYEIQTGGFSNLENRPIHFRSILFTIDNPSTVSEIYLRLEGSLPLTVISSLYTTNEFIQKIISYKFFTGAFYGFLTALSIYNLFLYFSLREKAYLFYVCYMWSFMVFQATMNTFDIELLGQLVPEWFFTRSLVLSCNLLVLFMILFGREFLELKKNLPKFYRLLTIALWLNILLFVAAILTPNVSMINDVTTVFTMIVLVLLWISGFQLLRKGLKSARFYMIGWTILLSSIVVQGLGFLGIIPLHPRIYEDVPAIGAIFEALFLSLALGDKISIIKNENERMQQALTETLEDKVLERTQQLEEAKRELEYLANTDRLTQLANRFRLDSMMDVAFKRVVNDNQPLSIILLDIDKFKTVNDTYGHQVGDAILIETAKLLTRIQREKDVIGRWGGEEFLIICQETTEGEALQLSEKIRSLMEQHAFPIDEPITGSFGIASYLPGDTVHTLISRCDKALYQAKLNGRNRVEVF